MADIRKYTAKEALNKVIYNNTSLNAYTLSEGLNAVLDDANDRLNIRLLGGTVSGDLIVTGALTVQGASTILESATVQIADKTFELAVPSSGSATDATSDGGGIILKGSTDKSILWNNANDWWNFNQGINITGSIGVSGTVDGVDIATRDAVLTSTTTTAGNALPKAGGAMTGAITTNSTFDGIDIAVRDAILTSTTTTAGNALPKAGGTMTGDLTIDKTTPLLSMKADANANTEINFYDGSTRIADISAQGTNNKLLIDARSGHSLVLRGGGADSLTIDTSQNATFAGTGTFANEINVTNGESIFSTATSWGKSLELRNTNDDAGPAYLSLKKLPASGGGTMADNDYIGFISMRSLNDADEAHTYVEIAGVATDVSNGSESSKFSIGTWASGTEKPATLVANAGNVGIGTASPATELEISGGGAYTAKHRIAHGTANYYWDIGYSDVTLGNKLQFVNRDGASAESTRMVIAHDGKVGIGTASPADDGLSIAYPGLPPQLQLKMASSGHVHISNNTTAKDINFSTTGTGNIYFSLGGANRLAFLDTGEVGIGTTTPSEQFEVSKSSGNSVIKVNNTGGGARLFLESVNSDNTYIKFADASDGGSDAQIGSYGSAYGASAHRQALEFRTGGSTVALTLYNDQRAEFAGAVEMDAGSFSGGNAHKGYKITNGSDGNGYVWANYMHIANGGSTPPIKLCQAYDFQGFLVSICHDGSSGSALDYVFISSANGHPTVVNIASSGTVPVRTYTRTGSWGITYISLADSGLGAHKVSCLKLGGY